jgi:GNAT superfamily N-acetyltransferase
MDLSLRRVAELTGDDRAALTRLSRVVYPPAEWADWPGRAIEWADAEWCVRVHEEDGALVSYTGIVLRDARAGGRAVRIGGVGGIKTHPGARGRGYAAKSIEAALQFFRDEDVAFALLVCEPDLLAYYTRLGWSTFNGRLLVRQREEIEEFRFNQAMTHSIAAAGPTEGVIDLCGPPW